MGSSDSSIARDFGGCIDKGEGIDCDAVGITQAEPHCCY